MRHLQVVERPIGSLSPYANNPRTHSRRQVRKIADSLERFGWTNPLLIDEDGNVIAGHGRLEAAKLLRMAAVPTICLGGLSDAERRAYVIADNQIAAQAGWDEELLRIEFDALIADDFDLELTGFDTLEIDRLFGADQTGETEEELELPEADAVAVSRPGDLWTIGEHRILCGDAREAENYKRLLQGRTAQMAFTDPPYNVRIGGNVSGLGRTRHREFAMASGEMTPEQFTNEFLRPVFGCLRDHAQEGAIGFICLDWRHLREFLGAAEGCFDEIKNLICWTKTNAGMGAFYRSQHELVLACRLSAGEHINNFGLKGTGNRHRSNVWTYPGVNTFRRSREDDLAAHPTVKPVKMVSDAILDCSHPNGIILDPFLGSGTTLLAAARTGRCGAGIEIDPLYTDVCITRLQKETGLKALHESGRSFAELRSERLQEEEA